MLQVTDEVTFPEDMTPEKRAEIAEKIKANQQRIREAEEKREATDLAETMAAIQQEASRQTGLTVPELLAEADRIAADPAEVIPERISREKVAKRGVPELHLRSIYDREPEDGPALKLVRDFLADPAQIILVLAGGVGTRKTGAACWALTQKAGVFVLAEDLGKIAASRDEDSITLYRQAKNAGLLVLDDLGSEYHDEKGWYVRAFSSLINARYQACAKTIITANLSAEKFKQAYGERVVDRIREVGRFAIVGGDSLRRKPVTP